MKTGLLPGALRSKNARRWDAERACLGLRDMTNYTDDGDKVPVTTARSTVPEETTIIGVDAEDRTHYYAAAVHDHRVFVDDGYDVQVFDLDETPCHDLEDWITHVRNVSAWDRLDYGKGLVELLADGLECGA